VLPYTSDVSCFAVTVMWEPKYTIVHLQLRIIERHSAAYTHV
jgi:hypothetical protein